MLTNDQYSLLQALFPPPSHLRGRPPLDDHLILDAVIYKIVQNIPWYDLPSAFPSHQTVYRRYRQWQRSGLWGQIIKTLWTDLAIRGEFDLPAAVSSGLYRVHLKFNHVETAISSTAPDAWQVATGYFILCVLLRTAAPQLKAKIEPLF